jgi:hypothetical protein
VTTASTTLTRLPLAQQTARNASPQELMSLLALQRSQSVDLVVPAPLLRIHNGLLEIAGQQPILRPDGVLDPNGAYRLTSHADGQLAGQFEVPVKYHRRMRDENIGLLDHNINDWANHPSYADKKILTRLFWADDPAHPETVGVARSFLSNRYGARDNFDAMASTVAGVREAGLAADQLHFHGDLTDRHFYLVIDAPEITGYAHKLVENYRSPYRNVHGGTDAYNLPIVSAGLIVKNSEVGTAQLSITPRITIRICNNGAQISKDVVAFRHTGARLDEGNVEWSADTREALNVAWQKQVRDAVKTFLTQDYVQKTVTELEAEADAPVNDVPKVMEAVAQEFGYTEAEGKDLMNFFMDGGQRTAGGVFNAVTAMVQGYDDPDRAYDIEAKAVPVMAFVAGIAKKEANA